MSSRDPAPSSLEDARVDTCAQFENGSLKSVRVTSDANGGDASAGASGGGASPNACSASADDANPNGDDTSALPRA